MSRDAIVIGAGIVGVSVAAELARAGLHVRILDAGFPGNGTTSAGMGHVVVMDDSPAQLALTAYSSRLLHESASVLPASIELQRCGTLWLAENDEQLGAARRKADVLNDSGISAEVIDAHDLRRAEPELRHGLAGAVHVPQDSVVYPPALCSWLLRVAVEHGAAMETGTDVISIEPNAVVTQHGRSTAEVVINAAGVRAPDLTPGLPVLPRRGHLVVTESGSALCHHQLVELGYMHSAHDLSAGSVAFNVQPRPAAQMLIGSSRDMSGRCMTIDRCLVARMLTRAMEFLPRLRRVRALRAWAGLRPATADGVPLVGRWDPMAGLWIAAGHEGLGITTALGTAALLADLILGRVPAIDSLPYSPARASADFPR